MLANRAAVVAEYAYAGSGGVSLCWLQPWDGSPSSALSFGEMDPFFIETCRRVRITQQKDRLSLRRTPTKTTRIAKPEKDARKGNTGDLWTPVKKKEGTSLHIKKTGFDYEELADLAFGSRWRTPSAQRLWAQDDHDGLRLVARGVSGGNCETHGYHERQIPLRSKMRRLLVRGDIGLLERIASERVDAVGRVHQKLRSALEVLLDNGKERDPDELPKSLKNKAKAFAKQFEQAEDLIFFDALSEEIEAAPQAREAIRLRWLLDMADRARNALGRAFSAGPRSAEQRYKARAAAASRLEGGLRSVKVLPALAEHYRQERLGKENNDDNNRDRAEP
jgi:CRISPR system Cascade subunit CasA